METSYISDRGRSLSLENVFMDVEDSQFHANEIRKKAEWKKTKEVGMEGDGGEALFIRQETTIRWRVKIYIYKGLR